MTRTAHAIDREARPRRSLKRLGYDLVDADRGQFYIRRAGGKVNETADMFGLDAGARAGAQRETMRSEYVARPSLGIAVSRRYGGRTYCIACAPAACRSMHAIPT